MTRNTATITAAASAVIGLLAFAIAVFAGGSGGSDPASAPPQQPPSQSSSPSTVPMSAPETKSRPAPQSRPLLSYVPTALDAKQEQCEDVSPTQLQCRLPIAENPPHTAGRILDVSGLEDTSAPAVRDQLCQQMADSDCEPKGLPDHTPGSYVVVEPQPEGDQSAVIRWIYDDQPVMLALTSQESLQTLTEWWMRLDLSPGS